MRLFCQSHLSVSVFLGQFQDGGEISSLGALDSHELHSSSGLLRQISRLDHMILQTNPACFMSYRDLKSYSGYEQGLIDEFTSFNFKPRVKSGCQHRT